MVPAEWLGISAFANAAALCLLVYVVWALPRVAWSRWVFTGIAALLALAVLVTFKEPWPLFQQAMRNTAFIAAFFIAQATLRHAATSSQAISRCGKHLASQPPGRRYLALTSGGHLFGLMLSYGSISLLGGMASANAADESNIAIREMRIKRMLLATQRGFISTLTWSPLAFSYAVSTSIIPGSSWGRAAIYGIVSALIIAGLGWLMDYWLKPPARPANRRRIAGSLLDLMPLGILLAIIMSTVALLQGLTSVRVVGVVLLAVPIISICWIGVQSYLASDPGMARESGLKFIDDAIPGYRSEIVLLAMAAWIGTLGSSLLLPVLGGYGLLLEALPGWLVLVSMVWIVPLSGLLGMNPVLSVTLLAPLLPNPAIMHVDPDILVVAITAGWALGGAISPFTATTLIVGFLAKVSAWEVGLRWNGPYTIIAAIILSLWVVLAAQIEALWN